MVNHLTRERSFHAKSKGEKYLKKIINLLEVWNILLNHYALQITFQDDKNSVELGYLVSQKEGFKEEFAFVSASPDESQECIKSPKDRYSASVPTLRLPETCKNEENDEKSSAHCLITPKNE